MIESSTDPKHFIKAVTELGGVRSVVTTRAIFNTKGVKVVEKGVAVNPGLYERLMEHQLSSPIEDAVECLPSITGRILRNGAEALINRIPFFARMAAQGEVRDLLLDCIEKVPLPAPIAFQLTLAYEVRPALYQHSLRTALVAAWLAKEPKISRLEMGVAAAAGLLHDIGVLHLDPRLLEHTGEINSSQRRQLYAHPIISTVLIECHPEYRREVVHAVMEHHEFLDGSGYPRNLAGDEISHVGRILALTELLVGVFSPGREASELRLSIQLRMNRHRYDEALAEKVIGILQLQPELSDEAVALLDDPVSCLLAVDGVLAAWPMGLTDRLDLSTRRRESLNVLTNQVAQLRRTLARVGAAPEQLAQLGHEVLDQPLQLELTLLAGEAAWQLRTLARQTRRRLNSEAGMVFFREIQQWLDRVDEVILGAAELS